MADLVRADGIHILVDLAGHTAGNRLPVFARRPAPVQGTWIGYPATTGLPAMDFRFTDGWADPPGTTEALHSERLVRLPPGFLCYRPPEDAPPVAPLPPSPPTFGSFNNLSKLNPAVVVVWAALLQAVPGARLLLKARALSDGATCARVAEGFAAHGIAPHRLVLVGHVRSPRDHLALYGEVDVALDPFPYTGTTTTCEALWMGVPVVTLAGVVHAARVGVSLLSRAGLAHLVARDGAEYVAIAARLIGDRVHLAALRADLRARLLASPLLAAQPFVRAVEDAYETLWATFLETAP